MIPLAILVLLLASAVLVCVLGFQNRGNHNVVTASATLIAAIAFYVLNSLTSLSESSRTVSLPVVLSLDRSKNFVGADLYSLRQTTRARDEEELMKKLMAAQPELLKNSESDVRRDFIMASILEWFATEQFDWRSEAKVLKTSQMTITTRGVVSQQSKSQVVSEADLRQALSQAGNVFAPHFGMDMYKQLLLPKGSRFILTSNSIEILHPAFRVKIQLDESAKATMNFNRRATNQRETMADGRPRYSSYFYELIFSTRIEKYRSGDSQRPELEAWFARLETGLQEWFESIALKESTDRIPVGSTVSDTANDH